MTSAGADAGASSAVPDSEADAPGGGRTAAPRRTAALRHAAASADARAFAVIDSGLTFSVLRIVGAIRRRILPAAGFAAVIALSLYALLAQIPPVYTATTAVWFDPRESRMFSSDSAWDTLEERRQVTYVNEVAPIVKEAAVLDSSPIYRRVIAELDLEDHPEVLSSRRQLLVAALKETLGAALPSSLLALVQGDAASDAGLAVATSISARGVGGAPLVDVESSAAEARLRETAGALSGIVDVTVSELPSIIAISVTSSDPAYAAAIANAIPRGFAAERHERLRSASRDAVDWLRTRVDELRGKVQRNTLGAQTNSAAALALQQLERDADRTLYESLLTRLNEVEQLQDLEDSPIRVVAPAYLPDEASGPGPAVLALAGGLAALLLAMGAIAGAELLDGTVRYPDQLKSLGIEPIAVAPRLPAEGVARWLSEPGWNSVGDRETGLFLEAIRRLLSATVLRRDGTRSTAILVTSGSRAEGKSLVAFALAATGAASGLRTVLVEADIRKPGRLAGSERSNPGLAGYLANPRAALADIVRHVPVAGGKRAEIAVLPATRTVEQSTELLGSERLRALLEMLAADFDLVVIDASPVCLTADSDTLAPSVDGVVLVVDHGSTPIVRVRSAIDLLDRAADNLVGAFVNRAPPAFYRELFGGGELYYGVAKATPQRGAAAPGKASPASRKQPVDPPRIGAAPAPG